MSDPQAIRVLIVDDDKSMRLSLVDLLEAAGFEAEALPRADQVMDRLPSFAPDVIVSDVRMPGMSGLDLLASLGPRVFGPHRRHGGAARRYFKRLCQRCSAVVVGRNWHGQGTGGAGLA